MGVRMVAERGGAVAERLVREDQAVALLQGDLQQQGTASAVRQAELEHPGVEEEQAKAGACLHAANQSLQDALGRRAR